MHRSALPMGAMLPAAYGTRRISRSLAASVNASGTKVNVSPRYCFSCCDTRDFRVALTFLLSGPLKQVLVLAQDFDVLIDPFSDRQAHLGCLDVLAAIIDLQQAEAFDAA